MSKIKYVVTRPEGQKVMMTSRQLRHIRKEERRNRLNGVMPDYRNHLPFTANSINHIFFFLSPITTAELKTPFVGHYSAEDNIPNPVLDGTPIEAVAAPVEATVEGKTPKKTKVAKAVGKILGKNLAKKTAPKAPAKETKAKKPAKKATKAAKEAKPEMATA